MADGSFGGGGTLTVAFGQRVVTVVLRSAQPGEGENNHKKHRVTERRRRTEISGDQVLTANQHAAFGLRGVSSPN